ncbi:hypothetical protein [Pleionea sediminis]|uniref:hypothetical protein n=1 Tax=Pleionea sediminis TaxID=2569479 RepID=UPI001186C51E|nr:hypothetical protein [Pleionea sediminis]
MSEHNAETERNAQVAEDILEIHKLNEELEAFQKKPSRDPYDFALILIIFALIFSLSIKFGSEPSSETYIIVLLLFFGAKSYEDNKANKRIIGIMHKLIKLQNKS